MLVGKEGEEPARCLQRAMSGLPSLCSGVSLWGPQVGGGSGNMDHQCGYNQR